jgi:hypothetical protein
MMGRDGLEGIFPSKEAKALDGLEIPSTGVLLGFSGTVFALES